MIYFISDTHFNHSKEFLYIPRGFTSVLEHNEGIIERWNSVVNDDDDVYLLGDCMLENNDSGMECMKRLNGKIHIIFGNHDSIARQELYKTLPNVVEICGYATVLKYKGYHFYLSHYPALVSNYDTDKPLKTRVISLCGHTHTQNKFNDIDKGLIYHVDADAHDCTPVSIDEIIEDIKEELKRRKSILDSINEIG